MAISKRSYSTNGTQNKYVCFNGKKYVFNLEKIKEICLNSSHDGVSKEFEISQIYDTQDSGELSLSQKIEHETKTTGNAQNDMIMYDVLKLLIVTVLENAQPQNGYQEVFSNALALNTLIYWGVVEEVE
jgi:hypothetical protein